MTTLNDDCVQFHSLLIVIYLRTHTDGVKSTLEHVSRLVFLFHALEILQ